MTERFDPERAVEEYRRALARLEEEEELPEHEQAQLRAAAQRLRGQWKAWHGEDSLHEQPTPPNDE
jgi:hypothetical protein